MGREAICSCTLDGKRVESQICNEEESQAPQRMIAALWSGSCIIREA
jgi:hypothetical protein